MRFRSMSRIRLPSGAIVVPGKSFTRRDRKSTRLNSSHGYISYAVFCLKKKKKKKQKATAQRNPSVPYVVEGPTAPRFSTISIDMHLRHHKACARCPSSPPTSTPYVHNI